MPLLHFQIPRRGKCRGRTDGGEGTLGASYSSLPPADEIPELAK